MKKTTRIEIVIARFGSDPEHVEVAVGSTIEEVLKEVGYYIGSSEKVFVNGDKAMMKDVVENKDNILLVSPKQAGR